jgi:hypothetical protein
MPPVGNSGQKHDTPGGMTAQRVRNGDVRRMLVLQYGRTFAVRPCGDRMSQQPEVTTISSEPMAPPIMGPIAADPARQKAEGGGIAQNPHPHGPQRIPHWLERTELFLRVLLRMYIGIAVTVAPWWPIFWEQNPLFLRFFPGLEVYLAHGAVRGVVSGLGLLNLWIAFRDAIRHRDG